MSVAISWLVHAPVSRREDGALTSNLASIRYRVLTPIREMRGEFKHRLVPVRANPPPELFKEAMDADVLVFSKVGYDFEAPLAREAQAAGKAVIFDVCDDHFQSPASGHLYRELAGLADEVVCNGPQMAAAAAPYARGPVRVIEDPYEGPRGEARFAPGQVLKLVWFGHPTNLDTLKPALNELASYASRRPLALTVLTELRDDLTQWVRILTDAAPPGFSMVAKPWSLASQWEELAACDAVVIPTLDTPRKHVKSANRMIEALWAGRPVAAQPLPAYAPFARWAAVHPRLSAALEMLLRQGPDTARLVAEAQDEIAVTYDPVRLAQSWAELMRTATTAKAGSP